jgi:hypothetical protein
MTRLCRVFFAPHLHRTTWTTWESLGPLCLFVQIYFFGEFTMTMFQRKRIRIIKEELEKQNAAVDASADNLLDKLKASKWTAAVLLGAALFAIALLWMLF